jgi:hypothetical protein
MIYKADAGSAAAEGEMLRAEGGVEAGAEAGAEANPNPKGKKGKRKEKAPKAQKVQVTMTFHTRDSSVDHALIETSRFGHSFGSPGGR